MHKKVEISYKTIVLTILTFVILWFLYTIRSIIMEFFVAILVMSILNPLVNRLSKYKIPRAVSVLLVYLILLSVTSFTIAAIVPSLVDQTTSFVQSMPKFIDNLGYSTVLSDQLIQEFVSLIVQVPSTIAKLTINIFSNIFSTLSILVFAFYLLSEREKLGNQLINFLNGFGNKDLGKYVDLLEKRLGDWARGQIILMLVVGFLNYLGFILLGIPFALPLAILAGLLEIIPYLGPVLAAIPAVIIGLGISPVLGFATTSLAFLVQQLENYILVPKIMQKSTGVNPITTLFCLAIGFKLAGVTGLLISIPVFITLKTFSQKYLLLRRN